MSVVAQRAELGGDRLGQDDRASAATSDGVYASDEPQPTSTSSTRAARLLPRRQPAEHRLARAAA